MEAIMGYTWESYTGAIRGSKNGPYMRVIMGYIWEPYMGAIYRSRIWKPYMEARIGHM